MSKAIVRLVATLGVFALLLAGNLAYSNVPVAQANGGETFGRNNFCRSSGRENKTVCEFHKDNRLFSVDILNVVINDVNVLSNFEITVQNLINIHGPLIDVGDVRDIVVIVLKDVANINVNICQVKVVEIGLVNINIADCDEDGKPREHSKKK